MTKWQRENSGLVLRWASLPVWCKLQIPAALPLSLATVLQVRSEKRPSQWAELGVVSLVIHSAKLGPRQTKIGRQKEGRLEYYMLKDLGWGARLVDYCMSHINVWQTQSLFDRREFQPKGGQDGPPVSLFLSRHIVCMMGWWIDCPLGLRGSYVWTPRCGLPLTLAVSYCDPTEWINCQRQQP